jgi:broad specificity phosphatase PhoE
MTMYLYLVRHGRSEGNVLKTFHGQIDYPLTEEGLEQARTVAEKLREVSFQRCCASDLSRARDTALACLAGRDVALEICPALREQHIGDLEGLTWAEMEERYPDLIHPYLEDWFNTVPPGGETPDEMEARVAGCVDQIIARGQDTLVVAHNGSLTLVLKHLGLASQDRLLKPGMFFGQGTYSAVRVDRDGAALEQFNV